MEDYDPPCEVCGGTHGTPLACDGCNTLWHGACLTPPVHEPPRGDWFCPDCAAHLTTPGTTLDTLRRAPHVVQSRVHVAQFAPSLELEDRLRDDGFGAEIDEYKRLQGQKHLAPRPDALYTNLQKQGIRLSCGKGFEGSEKRRMGTDILLEKLDCEWCL